MHRRYNLAHFLLAIVVALVLTPLMVDVEAQARIAFASDRDGNMEIYVMDADGGNPRRLTNSLFFDDRQPSWSPNGKRIAFVSEREGSREIYVMDADGKNPQNLTHNPDDNEDPSWSPDGKHIAFASSRRGNWEIYVIDADGGNLRNLTNHDFLDEWDPSWSPDGTRIAFVTTRGVNWEIYVIDTDGENQLNLTNHPDDDTDPAWYNPAFAVAPFAVSPAGKKFTMWGWLKRGAR